MEFTIENCHRTGLHLSGIVSHHDIDIPLPSNIVSPLRKYTLVILSLKMADVRSIRDFPSGCSNICWTMVPVWGYNDSLDTCYQG